MKKIVAEEHHGIPHAFSSETPSLSSGYTGKSSANGGRGGTASSRASSRNGGVRGGTATGRIQEVGDAAGKIIELEDDGEGDFGNLGSTGTMFDMLQKSVSCCSCLVIPYPLNFTAPVIISY